MPLQSATSRHVWMSDLRQQGLVIAPAIMDEFFPEVRHPSYWAYQRLRDAFVAFGARSVPSGEMKVADITPWLDVIGETLLGFEHDHWKKGPLVPDELCHTSILGDRIRPARVLFRTNGTDQPVYPIFIETARRLGAGRGRTGISRMLELCRARDLRIALVTNGWQIRLYYVGIDHDAWIEWDVATWFQEGELRGQLDGFLTLLGPAGVNPRPGMAFPLREAATASRTRQSELSVTLGEQVRQSVELLLACVNQARQSDAYLFDTIRILSDDDPNSIGVARQDLTEPEVRSALYQAVTRMVMRFVVILFAEARELLPRENEVYYQSYGIEGLYAQLLRANAQADIAQSTAAWPRLLALCALIHDGSTHEALTLRAYGGQLFAPGAYTAEDPIDRAMSVLTSGKVRVNDRVIFDLLRKLKIGAMRVKQGGRSVVVNGAVDFTNLRTEYIGMMYEGLLDYELRADDDITLFLRVGNEPALPLARLESMSDTEIVSLFTELQREAKAPKSDADTPDEAEDDVPDEEPDNSDDEPLSDVDEEDLAEAPPDDADAVAHMRAFAWARRAVVAAKLVPKPRGRNRPSAYEQEQRIDAQAKSLIIRVLASGELYLVRESGTRKGSGTFYTKPALAVPTVRRTLEPLAFMTNDAGARVPRRPEEILALKVVDPACGSASFLVAALHYLTEALWQSLQYYNVDGSFIRPINKHAETVLTVPGCDETRINEWYDSERFERRARARLRYYVVERCIYGVDINPLAVELGRLSLWVETLDGELPFTFLDHKVRVGNALLGTWLDMFGEYPLAAWQREAGDKNHSNGVHVEKDALSKQIRRVFDDHVKLDMKEHIRTTMGRNPQSQFDTEQATQRTVTTHAEARAKLEAIHQMQGNDATAMDARANSYAALRADPDFAALKAAMDRWCALWFWPAEMIDAAPLPLEWKSEDLSADKVHAAAQIARHLRFFHWEIEFPDVFIGPDSGFNAVVGNPPWDVQKPDSRDFFTRIDPIYRSYNKQDALRQQHTLFEREAQIEYDWLNYSARFKALGNWITFAARPWGDGENKRYRILLDTSSPKSAPLHADWRHHREKHAPPAYADRHHAFCHQGSADLNLYKLFAEVAHMLLRRGGRLGLIVPSALGSDDGARDLRALFLEQCQWEWDFVWTNKNKIFPIHGQYKFGATIVTKGGQTHAITTAFNRLDLAEWDTAETCPALIDLPATTISRLSPLSLAIVEPGSPRDLVLLEKLYRAPAILLGSDSPDGWGITYATEFHMTNDSGLFHLRPWWEERGYRPDAYGRWRNDEGATALPLYQGRMLNHFDFSEKGWVSGVGRRAVWREIPYDDKVYEPQFLMDASTLKNQLEEKEETATTRIGFMDIGSATNKRSMYSSVIPPFPCGNKIPLLNLSNQKTILLLEMSSLLNTFVYDYTLRQRLSGIALNYFILAETPLLPPAAVARYPLALWAARLTLIHPLWAREWEELRGTYPTLATRPWRAWWATDAHERLRLRCIIDAVVAHAWGLDDDDMAWLLRDDPHDPKGFWRVDKGLPYEQRQTGLTLAAFRDLQRVGVDAFCRDEWWGVPGCERPPATYAADAIAMGWAECAHHAQIISATDPLRAREPAEPAVGTPQSLWHVPGEQQRLPKLFVPGEQLRLGEEGD